MYLIIKYSMKNKLPDMGVVLATDNAKKAIGVFEKLIIKSVKQYGYAESAIEDVLNDIKKEENGTATICMGDNELGTVKVSNGMFVYYYDNLIGDVLKICVCDV